MYHTITKLPKSEIEIEVILSFEEFKPHLEKAARLISEEAEISGFRRGKAPYEIIKERLGEQQIYEKAGEVAVYKSYQDLLKKLAVEDELFKKGTPIGRPEVTVTKLAPGNEFVYKIRLALLPEVKLPDYKLIAKKALGEKKEVSVSEDEINGAIQWVRESRAPLVTVNRPAKSGDIAEIDFEVRNNGVKIAGGDSKNHPVAIGKGKFFPGFEDQLINMSRGNKKEFKLVAPENWHEKSLAGKELDFTVLINLVQEKQIPEFTDEFVKSLGDFSSVEKFKENVKEGILQEKKEKENQRIRMEIIQEIARKISVELPEVLIEGELEKMLQELQAGIEDMGMKWEDYLLQIKKTVLDLKKDWREEATKRVRIALCLKTIAQEEKIEAPPKEVEDKMNEFLRRFSSSEEAKKSIDLDRLREYTKDVVKNEKVFEFLESIR